MNQIIQDQNKNQTVIHSPQNTIKRIKSNQSTTNRLTLGMEQVKIVDHLDL